MRRRTSCPPVYFACRPVGATSSLIDSTSERPPLFQENETQEVEKMKTWTAFGVGFAAQNEKAARQRRPFLSRENSSNGGLNRQNFLAKSYESKKGGVKGFLRNKYLCFQ